VFVGREVLSGLNADKQSAVDREVIHNKRCNMFVSYDLSHIFSMSTKGFTAIFEKASVSPHMKVSLSYC
jgi:hypothetical protein